MVRHNHISTKFYQRRWNLDLTMTQKCKHMKYWLNKDKIDKFSQLKDKQNSKLRITLVISLNKVLCG